VLKLIFRVPDLEGRQKIGLNAFIEELLDLALIVGLLAAVGLLIKFAIRLVFWP
jgi:hypothetical protein